MGNLIYKPLIQDMVWSFSRVNSFDDCHYRWYLKYIKHLKGDSKFYASYGSFMHKLIEQYYNHELTKEQMLTEFLLNFKKEVKGTRPKNSILEKYIQNGTDYLSSFQPFPFDCVAVEQHIDFDINGIPFTAFVDFIGEKDGELYIVDHKSRALNPRGKRYPDVVTKNDETIDHIFEQMYVYSAAIEARYKRLPAGLCINAFRSGLLIQEKFDEEKYHQILKKMEDQVHRIENSDDFSPEWDLFKCVWICDVSKQCACHAANLKEMRRNRR